MPVCSIDVFKEKKAQGKLVTSEEIEELRQLLGKSEAKADDKKSNLYKDFDNYLKHIEKISKEVSDEELEESLEVIDDFDWFLSNMDEKMKVNVYKILVTLDEDDMKRFIELVTKINSVYETDVDIEKLQERADAILEDRRWEENQKNKEDSVIDYNNIHRDDSILDDEAREKIQNEYIDLIDDNEDDGIKDEENVPSFDEYLELKEEGKGLSDDEANRIGRFFRNTVANYKSLRNNEKIHYSLRRFGDAVFANADLYSTDTDEVKDHVVRTEARLIENSKDKDEFIKNLVQDEINSRNKLNEDIRHDYDRINEFKAFLEKKNESQKTNFEIIYEAAPDKDKKEFIESLKRLNSVYHLGLNQMIRSVDPEAKIEEYILSGMPNNKKKAAYRIKDASVINHISNFGFFINNNLISQLQETDSMLYKAWEFYGNKLKDTENIKDNYKKCIEYVQSLGSFLNRTEEGYDKTNFQRTCEALGPAYSKSLTIQLDLLNGYLNIGTDINKLHPTDEIKIENNDESKDNIIIENKSERESIGENILNGDHKNDINGLKIEDNNNDDNHIDDNHLDESQDNNIRINEMPAQNVLPAAHVTAAQYIEDIQAGVRSTNDMQLGDKIFKILAARHIADSIRNHRDRLDSTMVTEDQVNRKADELRGNDTINRFVTRCTETENMRRESVRAIGKGHGGRLDDMLKEYALKAEVGKLENSAVMVRYMPSAKERIEALQTKLKDRNKTIDEKRKIVLEIIKTRNVTRAIKGEKSSLEKPVPVSDPSISEAVEAEYNAANKQVLEAIITPAVIRQATSGHGGDMLVSVRENYNAAHINDEQLKKLVFGNTIEARMERLQNKARSLRTALNNKIRANEDTAETIRKSKKVIAEYLLLDGKTRGFNEINSDPEKLVKDVPWDKVGTLKRRGPDNERQFRNTFRGYTDNDFAEALQNLSSRTPADFVHTLTEKQRQLTEARNLEAQNNTKSNKKANGKGVENKKPTSAKKK